MEFARNVLGVRDAGHAEYASAEGEMVVTPLECSMVGVVEPVVIAEGTVTASLYGGGPQLEPFRCNYGLNPAFEGALEAAGLRVSARGTAGEARVLELQRHPFFVATLFLPQVRTSPEEPHPVLAGFRQAVERHANHLRSA